MGLYLTAIAYVLDNIAMQQLRAFCYIVLRLWNPQLNQSDDQQSKQAQRAESLQHKHLLFISKMFASLFSRKHVLFISKMFASLFSRKSVQGSSTPEQWIDVVSQVACDEFLRSQARMFISQNNSRILIFLASKFVAMYCISGLLYVVCLFMVF